MNLNFLRQIIRQYFSFSRHERNGAIFLCTILFLLIAINFSIDYWGKTSYADFTEIKMAIAEWETLKNKSDLVCEGKLFRFNPNSIIKEELDSLAIPKIIKTNIIKYRERGGKFYNSESVRKIYGMNDSIFDMLENYMFFDNRKIVEKSSVNIKKTNSGPMLFLFDPNHVSEQELFSLGFNNYQIQNIIKYKKRSGLFRSKTDMLKIYGIDSVFYLKIEPWIKIEESGFVLNSSVGNEGIDKIELNNADSSLLVKLYGIGPTFASRIIRYRNSLGGFYCINQLLEIYNFKKETFDLVKNKIIVDTVKIKKLSLNFSDYNEFARHPYLSDEDIKNILQFRNKNGTFETYNDLISKNIIQREKFEKLKPYLKIN